MRHYLLILCLILALSCQRWPAVMLASDEAAPAGGMKVRQEANEELEWRENPQVDLGTRARSGNVRKFVQSSSFINREQAREEVQFFKLNNNSVNRRNETRTMAKPSKYTDYGDATTASNNNNNNEPPATKKHEAQRLIRVEPAAAAAAAVVAGNTKVGKFFTPYSRQLTVLALLGGQFLAG